MNYYTVLELNVNATTDEIRKSYLKIAKTHHPDKTNDLNKIDAFKRALEAYDILIDPEQRKKYDLKLTKKSYTKFTTNSAPSFQRSPDFTQSNSNSNRFNEFGSMYTKHKFPNPSSFFESNKKTEYSFGSNIPYKKNQRDKFDEDERISENFPQNWKRQTTFQFKNHNNIQEQKETFKFTKSIYKESNHKTSNNINEPPSNKSMDDLASNLESSNSPLKNIPNFSDQLPNAGNFPKNNTQPNNPTTSFIFTIPKPTTDKPASPQNINTGKRNVNRTRRSSIPQSKNQSSPISSGRPPRTMLEEQVDVEFSHFNLQTEKDEPEKQIFEEKEEVVNPNRQNRFELFDDFMNISPLNLDPDSMLMNGWKEALNNLSTSNGLNNTESIGDMLGIQLPTNVEPEPPKVDRHQIFDQIYWDGFQKQFNIYLNSALDFKESLTKYFTTRSSKDVKYRTRLIETPTILLALARRDMIVQKRYQAFQEKFYKALEEYQKLNELRSKNKKQTSN
ncbi:hypothetical protein WICMUC_004918 [Wickerhamomyces mucosus]|uniref:J domain-containing protein n=1 Tax=Wickerhamomyces mucosus TaxID=1378264 RepID=A0A9P8T9H4_9ASCO|nr:hypothetical protein WICMUC_004918 [Wickerhamomyces mucosus]